MWYILRFLFKHAHPQSETWSMECQIYNDSTKCSNMMYAWWLYLIEHEFIDNFISLLEIELPISSSIEDYRITAKFDLTIISSTCTTELQEHNNLCILGFEMIKWDSRGDCYLDFLIDTNHISRFSFKYHQHKSI